MKTNFIIVLLSIANNVFAMDVTQAICAQGIFSERQLTKACNQNPLISSVLCQGNEAKVSCSHAFFDVNERKLSVRLRFVNKHVPFKLNEEPFSLYDYETEAVLHVRFDSSCGITDTLFDTSRLGFDIRLDLANRGLDKTLLDFDDAMLQRFRQLCSIFIESII